MSNRIGLILFGLLIVQAQNYGPIENTDRPFLDLPNMPISANNGQDCQAKCYSNPACASWAFDSCGTSCWLKSGVPGTSNRDCRQSGAITAARNTSTQTCEDIRRVATAGINSLRDKFWKSDKNWFVKGWPSGDMENYWTYAMALDAVVDAVEYETSRGDWSRYNWMSTAYSAISGQNSDWYDDEAWLAAVSARVYLLAQKKGDSNLANRAKSTLQRLYTDIHNAWDTSCCGNFREAIWWDRKHTQKATAATGGAIVTSMWLHNITGDRQYLDFAWQVNNPWVANMVQNDGSVCDHISAPSGAKTCGWLFTYNQGIMIGAATMISRANPGNPSQWNEAKRYVQYLLDHETVSSQWGPVLSDGGSGCQGDCKEFKAPTARYLRLFLEVGRKMYPQDSALLDRAYNTLKGSAYAIANAAYNSRDGTFGTAWTGPAPKNGGPVVQTEQNAAIQGLYNYLAVCK